MTFTPFGNLQNPLYQCGESYYDVRSGIIQSDTVLTGVGWVVPFPKRPGWVVAVAAGALAGDDVLLTREDFAPYELIASRHTPYLLELSVTIADARLVQSYLLGDRDRVCGRVSVEGRVGSVRPLLLARAWRPDGPIAVRTGESDSSSRRVVFDREDDERYRTPPATLSVPGSSWIVRTTLESMRAALVSGADQGSGAVGDTSELFAAAILSDRATDFTLELGADEAAGSGTGDGGAGDGTAVYGRPARELADEYERSLPRLTGDFPAHVRNGFAYDFETTRLCTIPPAGIFGGPWPTWMSSMPRVVLAEGSLDLARLGYMDDRTARDAMLTMFRDTPDDNVPCVFASGGYNMVAADETTCGTSPAWCIPFFNIYDLYLRTLDDEWLAELFPYLRRLIDYWLEHRTDSEGWLTYKCTWEAGEDNNPRIDPLATGDNVISDYVRPVELQASMAHAGYVLSACARILGKTDDVSRYEALHDAYVSRTRRLWDADEGRFRDWDKTGGRFIRVAGEEDYWGADFTRQSPLSLVALLFDTATDEQRTRMRAEVERFFRAPFTIWPSWSTFVLEAAAAIGMHRFAGTMAFEIVSRVYAGTDRRTIEEFERPLPGAAPEYWPHDWGSFGGNDAYAWGAQTASFVIRHVLGIRPSERRNGIGLVLAPSLSPSIRAYGSEFGVENLLHRGMRISVRYRAERGNDLACIVELPEERPLSLTLDGRPAQQLAAAKRHSVAVRNGSRVEID
jgi:hypothetical protein